MKIIGISPRLMKQDEVEKQFVNSRYVKQLTIRGLNTLMINIDNPNPEKILQICDGFLITGGYDINPEYFGEKNNGKSLNCNASLDKIDRDIVEHVKKTKKPLLGICRGHQVINVFFGGTLYQDIGDAHRKIKSGHIVYTVKNRLLPFEPKIEVNSYHHQAINKIAPDFNIFAHAEDGTVEAIMHRQLPIIGIQWHPEIITDTKESKLIFDTFAKLI